MGMLDKVVSAGIPPELMDHLKKLDAFEAMADDIKDIKVALNRLVEIEEAREKREGYPVGVRKSA
jgi:hypothetical protein